MSPSGPHSHAQNAADTNSATSDTPIDWPNRTGSTKLAATTSSTATSPTTHSGCDHPGLPAKLSAIGGRMASQMPTYGTYRMTAARNPHRKAYGTPSTHRPNVKTSP